jgi:hypothetical protein
MVESCHSARRIPEVAAPETMSYEGKPSGDKDVKLFSERELQISFILTLSLL